LILSIKTAQSDVSCFILSAAGVIRPVKQKSQLKADFLFGFLINC
jgi:hypothetical protein